MSKKSTTKKKKPTVIEPPKKVLVLRSCTPDLKSNGEFQWPDSGPVSCPDWKPQAECGNGLHGFLWGKGDMSLAKRQFDAKWLVVEVDENKIVDLGGKVKFPDGNVIFCGFWANACAVVRERFLSLPQVKLESSATGNSGHASATGNSGHASATGNSGHASATGNSGTAACLGKNGKAKSGEKGCIVLTYWDEKSERNRIAVGYVGENGIKPNTWYSVDSGKLTEVI